jgi:hydrogenase-4 membrane subunit HyfE
MTAATWIALALGLGIVVARRRSMAIGLLGLQSAVVSVAALALAPGRSMEFFGAAIVLVLKAVLITFLLWSAMRRTREAKPVRAGIDPMARLGVTLGAVLVVNLLVPPLTGVDAVAQQASLALVCAGLATVVLRRATIIQIIGLLATENGLALAAISIPGGAPAVIELGALFDVLLVVAVALAFHDRIYRLLGTGDSALLSELHD